MDVTCRRCLSTAPDSARTCALCGAPIEARALAETMPAPTTSVPVSQPVERPIDAMPPIAAPMVPYSPPPDLGAAPNPYANYGAPEQQQQRQQQQPQYQPQQQPQQQYPQPIQVVVQNQINVPYPQAPYPAPYPGQYPYPYPMQYPPGYGYPMVPYVRRKDPGIATLISFFLPGGGQFYNGQVGRGLAFLLVTIFVGFPLMFVGIGFFIALVAWIWSMIDAHACAERINRGELIP